MYKHTVQYYETDKMGITHHSNYIRWMEEARVDFLKSTGFGYDKLEEMGIISPVVTVECKYKKTTTFPEDIYIDVRVEEFRGIRLKLAYIMKRENGEVVFEGNSSHCFLNAQGAPIRVDVELPEFYRILAGMCLDSAEPH